MSKIKSITINDEDLSSSDLQFLSKVFKNISTELEEYEPKPKLLKRPDGSLISKPEEGTAVVFLDIHFDISQSVYGSWLFQSITRGEVFLEKDLNLAEKKAKQLTKQLEIQFEIDRLNAESGWITDWNNFSQEKFFLTHDSNSEIVGSDYLWGDRNSGENAMSEKTAEKILEKYSQEELKQYLGIII